MRDYIKPLLKKHPKNIILHIGTNDTIIKSSRIIFNEILSLKSYIEKDLPSCNVIISSIVKRHDNGKASSTVRKVNELLGSMNINMISNDNIESNCLARDGPHINELGSGKLTMNFIKIIKKFTNN